MKTEKNWLTCKEVAVLLNFSQRHILNLIKNKKLSAVRDEDGKYYFEKSEFFRSYPNAMIVEKARTTEKSPEADNMKLMEERIKHLQEMVEEKKKLAEFLREQLNTMNEEKSKMLDAINGHTRLLEFKESSIKANQPQVDGASKKGWWKFNKE